MVLNHFIENLYKRENRLTAHRCEAACYPDPERIHHIKHGRKKQEGIVSFSQFLSNLQKPFIHFVQYSVLHFPKGCVIL